MKRKKREDLENEGKDREEVKERNSEDLENEGLGVS